MAETCHGMNVIKSETVFKMFGLQYLSVFDVYNVHWFHWFQRCIRIWKQTVVFGFKTAFIQSGFVTNPNWFSWAGITVSIRIISLFIEIIWKISVCVWNVKKNSEKKRICICIESYNIYLYIHTDVVFTSICIYKTERNRVEHPEQL